MSTDPIRQAVTAQRGIVRYTLPPAFAPEAPAAVDLEALTPGTGAQPQPETGRAAFDRLLHDQRSGAHGR